MKLKSLLMINVPIYLPIKLLELILLMNSYDSSESKTPLLWVDIPLEIGETSKSYF